MSPTTPELYDTKSYYRLMHQSIPPAPSPPPPWTTTGHSPALSVPGVGHLQILHCSGAGHLPTPGPFPSFCTHAVFYQNITTQKVLLEKKQIGSSVKDRNKLKRVVNVCSRFYACIIKAKLLHSEIGAIDVNQRFLVIESNFC